MPALVVFDCFGTLVSSRPVPQPDELTAALAGALDLDPVVADGVVQPLYETLFLVMVDDAALQPATLDLVEKGLAAAGEPRDRATIERVLWTAWGCDEPGAYTLCEPVADAMRRVAAAGHTVRIMSNCFLPGTQMEALLTKLGAPAYDRAWFTADGGPKKPDPRAFALIGDGDFDRRVMVGDHRKLDIEPALALGWDAIRIDEHAPDPRPLLDLLGL